ADEVTGSDGAHQRPGRGWSDNVDQAVSGVAESLAVDVEIAAAVDVPPETRQRARIADEVTGSDGAHQRPGRGWA
ncbi:MAG: hypothetical protein JJ992_30495, partial [Planctomycetes bacterium]|nr:hypothetical protein [Planctomycetota bacterium]